MRHLTLAARAPQAVRSEVQDRKSFDASLLGYLKKAPLKRKFTRAEIEQIEAERREEELKLLELKAIGKEREQVQWAAIAKASKADVESFTKELVAIKYQVKQLAVGRPCFLNRALDDLNCSSKALGQFVRYFFGSDMPLRWFIDWMYESPDLHDGTVPGLPKEMRGRSLSQQSHRQQYKIRARLRAYLHVILKNCISEAFEKKLGEGNGNRLELFIANSKTRRRCCAIIDLNSFSVVAFYLEKEMNRRRSHRTARQLDYRRRRLH